MSNNDNYRLFKNTFRINNINTNTEYYKLLITYWDNIGFVKDDKILLYEFKNFIEILLLLIEYNKDVKGNFNSDEVKYIKYLLDPSTFINFNNSNNRNKEYNYVRLFILIKKPQLFKKILEYIDIFSVNINDYENNESLYDVFNIQLLKNIIENYGNSNYFLNFLRLIFKKGSDYKPIGSIRLIYKCKNRIYTIVKNSNNKLPNQCEFIDEKVDLGRVYNGLYAQWIEQFKESIDSNKDKFQYIINNWNIVEQLLSNYESYKKVSYIKLLLNLKEILENENIDINKLKYLIEKMLETDDDQYLLRAFLLETFLIENKISLTGKYFTKSGRKGTFLTLLYKLYEATKKYNEELNRIEQKKSKKVTKKKSKNTMNLSKPSGDKKTISDLAENFAFNNSFGILT